jgi:hypothetical protein
MKQPPTMHQFAVKFSDEIVRFLNPCRPRRRKLHELIRYRHELSERDCTRLVEVLRRLARDADSLADGFEAKAVSLSLPGDAQEVTQ